MAVTGLGMTVIGSHNKPQVEMDPNTNALASPKLVRELMKLAIDFMIEFS